MNYRKQIYKCSAEDKQKECDFFEEYQYTQYCTFLDIDDYSCNCQKAPNNTIKTDIDKVKISIETKDKTYHFYGELK